jgi:hypothetical protein
LRLHGLIKKVGKTYKYYLTSLGKSVITLGLRLKELPESVKVLHISRVPNTWR